MTTAAMLEFEMGRGNFPAVILTADQADSRNAYVFEKDGVLMAMLAAATAAAQQFHRLDGDAWQARIDHEPTQVFVVLTVGISYRERPHPLGAVRATDKNFLAVEHILVALADGPHF